MRKIAVLLIIVSFTGCVATGPSEHNITGSFLSQAYANAHEITGPDDNTIDLFNDNVDAFLNYLYGKSGSTLLFDPCKMVHDFKEKSLASQISRYHCQVVEGAEEYKDLEI